MPSGIIILKCRFVYILSYLSRNNFKYLLKECAKEPEEYMQVSSHLWLVKGTDSNEVSAFSKLFLG